MKKMGIIMQNRALLIGNSDGIGLEMTKRLLVSGWSIIGVSKSESPISNRNYDHHVFDVTDSKYPTFITELGMKYAPDLCIYFVGIGELFNSSDMRNEIKIFDVNLSGMVKTASAVIPGMVSKGQGHFIGISSLADELLSAEAPSYHASKAGFSNYLGSLRKALKPKGVFVTTVRFGFVDTKMAKGDVKPLMMSVEKAVDHLIICMQKKPRRYTAPLLAIPLIKFRKLMMRLQDLSSSYKIC